MATVCLVNRRIVYEKLWQTICILERQLLVGIMQNQHSSYSMSWSRNTNESCHLAVWLFHDNAPALKSLVAQQALCDCEFVQLNHPAYSLDFAQWLFPNKKSEVSSSCNLVYRWYIAEDHCRCMVWESKQKNIFSIHKQLRRNVFKMYWCNRRICRKLTVCVIWYVNFL